MISMTLCNGYPRWSLNSVIRISQHSAFRTPENGSYNWISLAIGVTVKLQGILVRFLPVMGFQVLEKP